MLMHAYEYYILHIVCVYVKHSYLNQKGGERKCGVIISE